jgi:hypothetical protein
MWRKLHNKELHDLYSSPTIFRMMKSRGMRLAGHVALMVGGGVCTGFWWGNLRDRVHWGDPGVVGRIILRCIFSKYDVWLWTASSWLGIWRGGGPV